MNIHDVFKLLIHGISMSEDIFAKSVHVVEPYILDVVCLTKKVHFNIWPIPQAAPSARDWGIGLDRMARIVYIHIRSSLYYLFIPVHIDCVSALRLVSVQSL